MEFGEFGPYRLESLLGRGGMGVVYEAFDTEHRRRVALKVLAEDLASDAAYRERFRREAYAAARLSDPHIVPIHRYGDIDGRLFLDMRLVRGKDLSAVLAERGPLPPRQAVGIVSQVAHALDSAHADGLVHRDVKPSNVLVSSPAPDADDDEEEFVYLVDFGIARMLMPEPGQPNLTKVGSAVGSFDYMAPERFLEQPADARADVYSLACVLFECLTGRRPFPVAGLAPLMWAHVNEAAPLVSALQPDLPRGLDEVVARGLAKDPGGRWPSAGALAAAARRVLTSTARLPSVAPPTPPVTDLSPGSTGARPDGGTGGAAVGGGGVGATTGGGRVGATTGGGDAAGAAAPAGGVPGAGAPGRPQPLVLSFDPVPTPAASEPAPATGGRGGRGGRRRTATVLVWAAALLVAALVGVLVLLDGGEQPLDRPEPPVAGPQHEDLLAILPPDYDAADCRPAPAADDGEVAAVDCGASASRPGPVLSRFFLYPDADTAEAAFLDDVARVELEEQPSGTSCPATQGHGTWEDEGVGSGRVACYVNRDNDAVLIWTEAEDAVEAVVHIRGGGTEGLTALTEWWRDTEVAVFGE
ncbi:serine/threonine-protein kinase [Trujillonella endophytica]|uniref:non-specific serine/threonine protein kinase n=1 Tax=Trujillonella endophytica TaxID=673521 RepID=A0A1H8QWN5_9ACTN|nr:serine/threonine-protein kinase [Trujillella endophytica]SEO58318.1 serine/threonine protein kinase [Trujillella endophytica]